MFILFFWVWFCNEWGLSYYQSIFMESAFIHSLLFQIVIGCLFGVLYFYGLVILNDGILRLYFFIMVFLGYYFIRNIMPTIFCII